MHYEPQATSYMAPIAPTYTTLASGPATSHVSAIHMSGATGFEATLPGYGGAASVHVKQEQHEHESDRQATPPQVAAVGGAACAPIDMADQERIKLERKRLRNRIAATKCGLIVCCVKSLTDSDVIVQAARTNWRRSPCWKRK